MIMPSIFLWSVIVIIATTVLIVLWGYRRNRLSITEKYAGSYDISVHATTPASIVVDYDSPNIKSIEFAVNSSYTISQGANRYDVTVTSIADLVGGKSDHADAWGKTWDYKVVTFGPSANLALTQFSKVTVTAASVSLNLSPSNASSPSPSPSNASSPSPGPSNASSPSPSPSNASSPSPGPSNASSPSPGPSNTSSPSPGPSNTSSPSPGPSNTSSPSPGPSNACTSDPNTIPNAVSSGRTPSAETNFLLSVSFCDNKAKYIVRYGIAGNQNVLRTSAAQDASSKPQVANNGGAYTIKYADGTPIAGTQPSEIRAVHISFLDGGKTYYLTHEAYDGGAVLPTQTVNGYRAVDVSVSSAAPASSTDKGYHWYIFCPIFYTNVGYNDARSDKNFMARRDDNRAAGFSAIFCTHRLSSADLQHYYLQASNKCFSKTLYVSDAESAKNMCVLAMVDCASSLKLVAAVDLKPTLKDSDGRAIKGSNPWMNFCVLFAEAFTQSQMTNSKKYEPWDTAVETSWTTGSKYKPKKLYESQAAIPAPCNPNPTAKNNKVPPARVILSVVDAHTINDAQGSQSSPVPRKMRLRNGQGKSCLRSYMGKPEGPPYDPDKDVSDKLDLGLSVKNEHANLTHFVDNINVTVTSTSYKETNLQGRWKQWEFPDASNYNDTNPDLFPFEVIAEKFQLLESELVEKQVDEHLFGTYNQDTPEKNTSPEDEKKMRLLPRKAIGFKWKDEHRKCSFCYDTFLDEKSTYFNEIDSEDNARLVSEAQRALLKAKLRQLHYHKCMYHALGYDRKLFVALDRNKCPWLPPNDDSQITLEDGGVVYPSTASKQSQNNASVSFNRGSVVVARRDGMVFSSKELAWVQSEPLQRTPPGIDVHMFEMAKGKREINTFYRMLISQGKDLLPGWYDAANGTYDGDGKGYYKINPAFNSLADVKIVFPPPNIANEDMVLDTNFLPADNKMSYLRADLTACFHRDAWVGGQIPVSFFQAHEMRNGLPLDIARDYVYPKDKTKPAPNTQHHELYWEHHQREDAQLPFLQFARGRPNWEAGFQASSGITWNAEDNPAWISAASNLNPNHGTYTGKNQNNPNSFLHPDSASDAGYGDNAPTVGLTGMEAWNDVDGVWNKAENAALLYRFRGHRGNASLHNNTMDSCDEQRPL